MGPGTGRGKRQKEGKEEEVKLENGKPTVAMGGIRASDRASWGKDGESSELIVDKRKFGTALLQSGKSRGDKNGSSLKFCHFQLCFRFYYYLFCC